MHQGETVKPLVKILINKVKDDIKEFKEPKYFNPK
jgi:hypothetical protein